MCIILLIGGCETAGNLNIVSPSTPEDETRARIRTLPTIKELFSPRQEQAAREKTPQEKIPSIQKVSASEEQSTSGEPAQEALINLLEKKGVITKKELMDEIKKLKQRSK